MEIKKSKKTNKYLSKIQPKSAKRIVDAIKKLPNGDVVAIVGGVDEYRLRVGDVRVLFKILNGVIYVSDIKPRGDAYKK
jgi:mRNA-degrading endonuclease RelE of RelBE toxin-antitoxin system